MGFPKGGEHPLWSRAGFKPRLRIKLINLTVLLGTIAGVFVRQFVVKRSENLYVNVDPIEERTRDWRPASLNLYRRAAAFFLRVDSKTADAWIKGDDERVKWQTGL
jgi:hypothetical protein